jgi:hypothetical protein
MEDSENDSDDFSGFSDSEDGGAKLDGTPPKPSQPKEENGLKNGKDAAKGRDAGKGKFSAKGTDSARDKVLEQGANLVSN